MSKVLDKAFLESVFPPERTEAFFDALFGGAEEGAYDIVLVCRSEGEGKAELAFELHQRPGKCLACNLTYGLPQVFQRHPILNVAGVARAVAEKLGWPIFVKPANAGSSVGISKARDMAELEAATRSAGGWAIPRKSAAACTSSPCIWKGLRTDPGAGHISA